MLYTTSDIKSCCNLKMKMLEHFKISGCYHLSFSLMQSSLLMFCVKKTISGENLIKKMWQTIQCQPSILEKPITNQRAVSLFLWLFKNKRKYSVIRFSRGHPSKISRLHGTAPQKILGIQSLVFMVCKTRFRWRYHSIKVL